MAPITARIRQNIGPLPFVFDFSQVGFSSGQRMTLSTNCRRAAPTSGDCPRCLMGRSRLARLGPWHERLCLLRREVRSQ
jgi:hypothetical protein